tara:strand:+ start:665 stop:1078 length:414 start_codon:yes stop_codon:yes gene_type:complete
MAGKPHNRTWYIKKLSEVARKYAKERDGFICQKCGKESRGSNAHGSHILCVGQHKNMELNPDNIKCLCYYCHMNWWHKDVLFAAKWFINKFPERYERLMAEAEFDNKLELEQLKNLYEAVQSGEDYADAYGRILMRR